MVLSFVKAILCDSKHIDNNNCYAYALNLVVNYKGTDKKNGRINPGDISNKKFTIRFQLISDVFIRTQIQ